MNIELIANALRAAHPYERQRNNTPAQSRAKCVQHRLTCHVFAHDLELECSRTGQAFDRAQFLENCGYPQG